MTDAIRPEPTIIEPLDLEAAASALCCRFGEASAEAYRLATLHDMLTSSRALTRALESFTSLAAEHYRGIHCTADMRGDAQRLSRALAAWSDTVFAAGTAYREWTTGGIIAGLTDEHAGVRSGPSSSFTPIIGDRAAPIASSV